MTLSAQSGILGGQKCCYLARNPFFGDVSSKMFVFHVRHQDGRQGIFLVLKSAFLMLSPHNPPFLGSDESDSKQLIASYDIS